MPRNMLIINSILLALSVFSILVKLFTVEIWFPDDPTVELIIRSKPSLTSRMIVENRAEYPKPYKRILVDENGFIGENIYYFNVKVGWIGLPVLWMCYSTIIIFKWKKNKKSFISD